MHKSRLGALIIDCRTPDLEAAAGFWARALGLQALPADPGEPKYVTLETAPNDPAIEIQQVSHDSRVHIDIETDDIEAEARRLAALGARLVTRERRWQVMRAPTGQRFCLVRPQRADFETAANTWD